MNESPCPFKFSHFINKCEAVRILLCNLGTARINKSPVANKISHDELLLQITIKI